MQEISYEIGRRIRHHRLKNGMTQEKLAEKADLHHTYIGQIERGEKNMTLVSLEKITTALGITFTELFEHIEEVGDEKSIPAKCYQLIQSKTKRQQSSLYRLLLEAEELIGDTEDPQRD